MKLKGTIDLTSKIQKAIQKYIKLNVNVEICDAFLWADNENTLFFTPVTVDEDDKLWKQWIEEVFKIKFNNLTDMYYFSFLHELGHKMTLIDVTDEEYEEGDKLSNGYDHFAYWNCYREYIATKWAVDFCLTHQKEMVNFCEEV